MSKLEQVMAQRICLRKVLGGKFDVFVASQHTHTGFEPECWTRVFYDKKEKTVKHLSGVQRKPLFYVTVARMLENLGNEQVKGN